MLASHADTETVVLQILQDIRVTNIADSLTMDEIKKVVWQKSKILISEAAIHAVIKKLVDEGRAIQKVVHGYNLTGKSPEESITQLQKEMVEVFKKGGALHRHTCINLETVRSLGNFGKKSAPKIINELIELGFLERQKTVYLYYLAPNPPLHPTSV